MKYRHDFHAGNFADIHKHVTLVALLNALKRKDKGFAYFETHAGRGAYDLSRSTPETKLGVGRFSGGEYQSEELRNFAAALQDFRLAQKNPRAYPGSPALAAGALRAQDRAILSEIVPAEASALQRGLAQHSNMRIECQDGFERLRAWLPPRERRGLILIDPPYEEREDFSRVMSAVTAALQRFGTGVCVAWYPIKDERTIQAWHEACARVLGREAIASELWLYPRDSVVALNGSGILIVNPPFLIEERMQTWLPELYARLDVGSGGGYRVVRLTSGS